MWDSVFGLKKKNEKRIERYDHGVKNLYENKSVEYISRMYVKAIYRLRLPIDGRS